MKRILVFFTLLASLFSATVMAEQTASLPGGDFSQMRETGYARVAQIVDPQTLQLEDGRIIRLSGVNYPDYNPEDPGPISMLALDILRDMLDGQEVVLHQTPREDWGRTNRMGHHIAQLERKSDHIWVQGSLLTLGVARVYTTQRNPEMAAQMYALEAQARQNRLGLWETQTYTPLSPETSADHLESFQIVEGRVESVALKNNRIYINFGKDWRTDFTVSIAAPDKKIFTKQAIDPLQWNGRVLRVRGWLQSYNGPYIEIDHPEAVEALTETKTQ